MISTKEHQALFASIVNSSDDAILSKTLSGIITSWNEGAQKLFGYTAEEIIGKNVSILIPADRINEEPEIIERIRNGENVDHYETQRMRKDGSLVYISLKVSPIRDKRGKIIGASKIARDISDRKKAEEAIEKSENRFRALLENNNDAITLHDTNGVVFYQSPAVERITGYTPDDLKNKSALDMFHPDYVEEGIHRIKEAMAHPGKSIYGINRLKRKDGEYIWTEGTTTNLLGDENVKALVGNFRDITDRKIAEEKILKSSRLYAFLSGINQAIVHNKDEQSLFNEVCRVAVEIGRFEFAWMGAINENGKQINLVAEYNAQPIDLELLSNAKYDPNGPTAKAFNSGNYYLSNEIGKGNEKGAWTEYIKMRMFQSMMVFPIKKSGKTVYTLNIYSLITHFFDETEIALLVEAAGDISYALDVFEKEEKVAQSEARLKAAQKMAHLGNWEVNLSTGEVSWSDENYRIYGLEPGSVIPTTELSYSFFHPEDVSRVREDVENAMSNFTPMSHFRRIVLKSGEIRHVYAEGLFDFDESNKPIRFHGTNLDITDITKKEEELKKSELRFREFFDNAPEAIVIVDIEAGGAFVMGNNNAKELLGYPIGSLIGKTTAEISPEFQPDGSKSVEKVNEYIKACVNGEKVVFDWVVLNTKSEEIRCEVRLVKLSGMGGNTLMATIIDITERKNNEILKEKMTADLVQRNSDLEQFTYIVSHNLRAPVANIIGVSEILQLPELDIETSKTMLTSLSNSVTRLDTVIKDLNHILQVKREVSEKNETVQFSKTVEDIKMSISNLLKNENALITYNFDKVDEFFTLKSYLHSIFYNLISNSIKYRKPDTSPVIEIASFREKNKIILTFKDNGLGIDLEKKGSQVFGLYKRFHLHKEGKGMGLYMTKTQVETMGGSITVTSKVNEGTEFRIAFEAID